MLHKGSQRGISRYPRKVYSVDCRNKWSEESATIPVEIDYMPSRVLLDTGARIIALDAMTMKQLRLEDRQVAVGGEVFGVCNTPVKVIGYVEVRIKIPGERELQDEIQVLAGEGQELLLGRQFMHKFRRVVFDGHEETVELGKAKIPIFTKINWKEPKP